MGTECITSHIGEGGSRRPFSPDDFLSLTSFTLERVHDDKKTNSVSAIGKSPVELEDMDTQCSTSEEVQFTRCLRRRPWINYGIFDGGSDEESDLELFDPKNSSKSSLPKGVIRGCSNCDNCQKQVVARWRQGDARRPIINEAPVFYPSEEEFKDPLKYIASIGQMVEPYGICRIVPPPSWKPPCPLKEKHIWENDKFATRIQQVHKLQNRESMTKKNRNTQIKKKRRKCLKMGSVCGGSDPEIMNVSEGLNDGEGFGFVPGPQFTLESFQKYADDFVEQYFGMKDASPVSGSSLIKGESQHQQEPLLEDMEGEYWRMVEKPTEEIEVLYGADLDTGGFGSGFPKACSDSGNTELDAYVKSGWNLNNLARLAGSMLSFEKSNISGVLVPWLYIGMCFSSFCWHVEDHHFYSFNYMHWGAPKLWYGVPGSHALNLEAAMKKHLPDLFDEQPDLLHKLVTQLSPTILKSEGVPVYRCVQRSGEFVLTFPRAYHSGFNCGFNCAEAVNVAPIDWLSHGQNAVELYSLQRRKTSVSHDKLLLGAARDAIRALWEIHFLRKETPDNLRWQDVCGKDGILTMALQTRVDIERSKRQIFSEPAHMRKMDVTFDATDERECVICYYDLHLSAVCCECSQETFTCLNHAKQLCLCPWNTRIFLFRYEITELDTCIEALGGKLSAIHRFANVDLGLSLSSHITKKEQFLETQNKDVIIGNPLLGETKPRKPRPVDDLVSFQVTASVDVLQSEMKLPTVHPNSLGKTEVQDCITQSISNLVGDRSCDSTLLPELKVSEIGLDPKAQVPAYKQIKEKKSCMEPCQAGVSNTDGCEVSSSSHSKISSHKSHCDGYPVADLPVQSFLVCHLSEEDSSYVNPENSTEVLEGTSIAVNGNKANKSESGKCSASPSDRTVISLSDDDNDDQDEKRCDSLVKVKVEKSQEMAVGKETAVGKPQSQVSGTFTSHESTVVDGKAKQPDVSNSCIDAKNSFKMEDSCSRNLGSSNNLQNSASSEGPNKKHLANGGSNMSYPRHLQVNNCTNTSNVQIGENVSSCSAVVQMKTGPSSQSGSPSRHIMVQNMNRNFQKGPRMAKVVRRFNCTVELLDFGLVVPGKAWCNRQTIFPKGFRSRVRYRSVIDPTQMCCYISEILDSGNFAPLFRVVVEDRPSEVFIYLSANKCWDMVREKVNQEIVRQHSQDKPHMPPLQPPGSVDGIEMFGLSSPSFVEKIGALDPDCLCSEYWKSRPNSHNSEKALPKSSSEDKQQIKMAIQQSKNASGTIECILRNLIKKADPEELHALHGALSNENLCFDRAIMMQAVKEEIRERQMHV